jgi:hypothetical protein
MSSHEDSVSEAKESFLSWAVATAWWMVVGERKEIVEDDRQSWRRWHGSAGSVAGRSEQGRLKKWAGEKVGVG